MKGGRERNGLKGKKVIIYVTLLLLEKRTQYKRATICFIFFCSFYDNQQCVHLELKSKLLINYLFTDNGEWANCLYLRPTEKRYSLKKSLNHPRYP